MEEVLELFDEMWVDEEYEGLAQLFTNSTSPGTKQDKLDADSRWPTSLRVPSPIRSRTAQELGLVPCKKKTDEETEKRKSITMNVEQVVMSKKGGYIATTVESRGTKQWKGTGKKDKKKGSDKRKRRNKKLKDGRRIRIRYVNGMRYTRIIDSK